MRRLTSMALALFGCQPQAAQWPIDLPCEARSPTDELGPLWTKGSLITDSQGRVVLLRGVENQQLEDIHYGGREIDDADREAMRSWGLNSVRMAISWSRIESERGRYDDSYVDLIVGEVRANADAGLYTILEMHQDLWGRCANCAASDSQCTYGNGAPAWTCTHPPNYPLSFTAEFEDFFANVGGLSDSFEAMWLHVLERVGGERGLVAVDVLNEPASPDNGPTLVGFYRRILPVLRDALPDALLIIEPPLVRTERVPFEVERLDVPGLVYGPHLYHSWINTIAGRTPELRAEVMEADFELASSEAQGLGAIPWWDGEWGVPVEEEGSVRSMQLHMDEIERNFVGTSYWGYRRGGSQYLLGPDGRVREEHVSELARIFPIGLAGAPVSHATDLAGTYTLRFRTEGSAGPSVLSVPGAFRYASGVCVRSSDEPGRWSWALDSERGRLLLCADPARDEHTITVRPGACAPP